MTTYTLTQELHKFICDVLYGYCFGDEIKAYELLCALKPNSQEPVAYSVYDPLAKSEDLYWEDDLGDMDGKEINPLYTNPSPISKEDMVKVLELLNKWNRNSGVKPGYEFIDEAITIMQSAIEGIK